jgi:hypothetical protein
MFPMRSSLTTGLAVLLLCIAAAPAIAQVSEPDGSAVRATPVSVSPVESNAFPLAYQIRHGVALLCGHAPDKRSADISCHIQAKVTIKSAVARFLGLSSTVIASGVAGNVVNHLKDDEGNDEGRAYFLEMPAAVKAKLRAKHARGLGVHITGRYTAHTGAFLGYPSIDTVLCDGSEEPTTSCSIKAPKRVILPAGDGELVCWPFMPWYLATSIKYGQWCPRPHQI